MKDLAGLQTKEDTEAGLCSLALCEDCGSIMVDHTGKCLIDHTHEVL